MGFVFLGVACLALMGEIFTKRVVAVWLVPGALAGAVLAFSAFPWWVCTLVCVGSAGVCVLLAHTVFARWLGIVHMRGIEAAVGKKCVVTERIDNSAGRGEARVGTQEWAARSVYDADVYEVGEVLTVVAIEGVRLVCRR